MAPISYYWEIFTSVIYSVTLSPFADSAVNQHPIGPSHDTWRAQEPAKHGASKHLIFPPLGSNIDGFKCDYSRMVGWRPCHSSNNTSCWLESDGNTEYNRVMGFGNKTFDINTDYEAFAPWGIQRDIILNITDGWINADGINFTEAKLYNNSFPAPLIEACWGDRVNITVTNRLKLNGTTIHWHGIRQNQTMHMDGVNGVTQCPIAPNDTFSYIFNITQYGSSWYHSHHSVQYADGAHGPMTLHGPSSMNYDEAISPLIMTDWFHNSAFAALYIGGSFPNILLDGTGDITRFMNTTTNTSAIPAQYNVTVLPPGPNGVTRYLFRLMNTAFQSAFTFSIDNHNLTIVEADFVPVKPHVVTSLTVAIGQRYNIIVEANPIVSPNGNNPLPKDWNFWIRTGLSKNCHEFYDSVCHSAYGPVCTDTIVPGKPSCFAKGYKPLCQNGSTPTCLPFGMLACPDNSEPVCSGICPDYDKAGILHYSNASIVTSPSQVQSLPWRADHLVPPCFDNLSATLQPIVNWTIKPPKNVKTDKKGQTIYEQFDVDFFASTGQYGTAFVSLDGDGNSALPFQTSYGNPTFLNLDNLAGYWPDGWMVIPEDYSKTDWVFLVLTSPAGSHPWSEQPYNGTITPNMNNPLRRDVVILPNNGFVVIAFQTDNPGNWMMHCHIAFHAAGGLALQILERQKAANKIWPPGKSAALSEAHRVCMNWNSWAYDCTKQWPGNVNTIQNPIYPACINDTNVQNDSGV